MVAWTSVVEMEVVRSSQVLDSFSRKNLQNLLMDWMDVRYNKERIQL